MYYYEYKIDKYVFKIGEEKGKITYITRGDVPNGYEVKETGLIKKTKEELEEYFRGERVSFSVPILLKGTDFQVKVWEKMREIPYGKIVSYKDLAKMVGNAGACRAIGNVCHNNNILIIVPCHRVVASHGLGGFGCGLEMKIDILELEKRRGNA